MALFDLPNKRSSKAQDSKIIKKANSKTTQIKTIRSGDSLASRIATIKALTEQHLGKYKDQYLIINDKDVLHDYITECIGNSYISIDTETDGLDPLQNKLAGICPYTYGQKGAYIPLNHISYITGVKSNGQLDMDFVISEFKRLLAKKPDIDMFNAKFDIRFLRANGLQDIYCTWDGYLASQLMNENEPSHGLKPLHDKYVLDGKGEVFSYGDLFKGIPFTMIPYNIGYLYAAGDPVKTTELCDYQRPFLTPGTPECEEYNLTDVAWVFHNIEMPCLPVVADMEDTGIELDLAYTDKLSQEYNKRLEEKINHFHELCGMYQKEIDAYRNGTHIEYDYEEMGEVKPHNAHKVKNVCKLDDPINIGSPTQIAILLYDIMKVKPVDQKNPRGTGEDILLKIDNDITRAILEYRSVSKLLSTYIDKLPDCVNKNDGRIHCSFNQYGAKTGRFSSSDPNLQNIPSHNKDIRKMFVASDNVIEVLENDKCFSVDRWSEVNTSDGWKYADKIVVGDKLIVTENDVQSEIIVTKIENVVDNNQIVYHY